jgi:hypothetical protein
MVILLTILGIAPFYITASLMLFGALNQRKQLRREIRQYANLRRVAKGRTRNG